MNNSGEYIEQLTVPISFDELVKFTKHKHKTVLDQFENLIADKAVTDLLARSELYGTLLINDFESFFDVLMIDIAQIAYKIKQFHKLEDGSFTMDIVPAATNCGAGVVQSILMEDPILEFIPRIMMDRNRNFIKLITIDAAVIDTPRAEKVFSAIENSILDLDLQEGISRWVQC